MADYAPNFTARYKLRYSFEGDTHVNVTRWPSAGTLAANVAAAIDFWTSFFTATAALRHTSFAVIDAEYALADSNVFLPATAPTEVAPGTLAPATGPSTRIMHSIWQGRSGLGSRSRFQVFGLKWANADDVFTNNFYISATENPLVGTIATLLRVSGQVAPDDEVLAVVRPRVAYKQNDAWVDNRRAGGA